MEGGRKGERHAQQAVVDVLTSKTIRAARYYGVKSIMLAGGVAANRKLRDDMDDRIKKKLEGVGLFIPAPEYATDNAAMIAAAAAPKEEESWKEVTPRLNMEL